MNVPPDYQIVVIECPYDSWSEGLTRDLFGKMIALKLTGYLSAHRYGALPFDASDFVGCHYMLCAKSSEGLLPVQACKLITLNRCKIHGLPFPPLTIAAGYDPHLDAVTRILERTEHEAKRISYDSSWTIDPRLRRKPGYPTLLKEILTATIVHLHREYEIDESICLAIPRLKTEQYFHFLGYRPINISGIQLEVIPLKPLLGEGVICLHKQTFTAQAVATAERYSSLWKKRLVIRGRTV
jgi:hypothetical protein